MLRISQSTFNLQFWLGLLLIASPWLILIYISLIFGHSVTQSIPVWSDELSYWHEILSLSHKGLNHGYYTYNEVVPAISNFGSHGFGTVSVYTLFAKVFGWKAGSMLLANAFFMSLAFLCLMLLLRPTAKVIAFILIFSLLYPPYLLFSVTSMSEGLNYAMLIVYFALLQNFVQKGKKSVLWSLFVFCILISFVRIIYIVLFLPLLFIGKNEIKFNRNVLIHLSLWVFGGAILFLVSSLFVAPYPDSFLHELFSVNGLTEKISLFSVHFADNLSNFLNPFSDTFLQVFERYFVLIVLIYSFIKSGILQSKLKKIEIRYFVVFLILILVLLISLGAYDVFDWRDYRVLSPVLFGCVLYLILIFDFKEITAFLTFNLIGLLIMMTSVQSLKLFTDGRYNKPIVSTLLSRIEYTAITTNCFDNTLAVKSFNQNLVMNVPAGIGISTVDSLSDKLHSKYIFSENALNLKTYTFIDSDTSGYLYRKVN